MSLYLGSFPASGEATVRSMMRAGRGLVTAAACLAAVIAMPTARAQSTWLPTTGTFSWLTSGSWSNGSVPNATGAVAIFPIAASASIDPSTTITTGTIETRNSSGSVVIGDNTITTDTLRLDVASGSPSINVSTGANLFMYASVTGSQGFTKTGGGNLTFRFNTGNMTYSGTVTLGQGTLTINQDGSLGSTSNPILVTGNANLTANPSPAAVVTLDAGRTATINSGVTWTMQNGGATGAIVANNAIGGAGNLQLSTGTFTLNGNNTYAGNTTLNTLNRLTLGSGARLSSGGLTLTSGSSSIIGTTVDLGGNTQSVSSLSIATGSTPVTTTFTNGSLNVTGGSVTFTSGFSGTVPSGTAAVNMSGLSSFSYSNASGLFRVQPNATSAATVGINLTLANAGSGSNTITSGTFLIGGAASSAGDFTALLGFGKDNTVNTSSFEVGGFQGSGTASFQSAASSLVVRGTAGGASRTDAMIVGWTNSGNKVGNGFLNLGNGSLDALATNLVIGRHGAGAQNAVTGSVSMGSGTLDATTITLGEKTATSGTGTYTATFSQTGGLVKTGTMRFGNVLATANALPSFNSVYSLTSGTLRAALITTQGTAGGTVASGAGSVRRLAWEGGTLAPLDAASNLVVSGTSLNAGYLMQVVLGGSAAKILATDAGRTITFDTNTLISGTGGLTVNGAGTVVINGSSSYSGGTTLSAGTLRAGNANAFGGGGIAVASGATLDLDSLAVANAITNNGGTLSNAANYAGSQTLAGASTFGNVGGSLTVANGGVATLNGLLGGGMTVNGGGSAILGSSGAISGPVTVAAGALLGGLGTITNTVTVFGTLSPGTSPGLVTFDALSLQATATTIIELSGTSRGTGYDAIDVTQAGGLTYGGALSLSFGSLFDDGTTFDLFGFTGAATGAFASVASTGSYAGTWSDLGGGVFELASVGTDNAQTLTFTPSTGDLTVSAVVPEASTLALVGAAGAFVAFGIGRRRSRRGR